MILSKFLQKLYLLYLVLLSKLLSMPLSSTVFLFSHGVSGVLISNGVGCPCLFSRLRRILSMVPRRGSASYHFICDLFHLFSGGSATTYQAPVFSKEGSAADHNVACGYLCFSVSAELGKPAGAPQTVVPAGSSDKSVPNVSHGKVQKRSDVARTIKGQLTSQRQYCAEEKAKTVSSPKPWRLFSCWHALSHEVVRARVTFLLYCL